MDKLSFKQDLNLFSVPSTIKWLYEQKKQERGNLTTFGTMVFSGPQGSGKTLSSVCYVKNLINNFPLIMLVSNIKLTGYPFNAYMDDDGCVYYFDDVNKETPITPEWLRAQYVLNRQNYKMPVIEYTGLQLLLTIRNNKQGVVFLIDELHLELNSLESKNIPMEVMTEIAQQRKQRIHIVGASQVAMRLAKPLREQIHDLVICKNYFHILQHNIVVAGDTITEKDGKMSGDVKSNNWFFHTPEMYESYDTYQKMKRYSEEWLKGVKQNGSIYNTFVSSVTD